MEVTSNRKEVFCILSKNYGIPISECMFDEKISDFSTLKVCKIVEGNLELDDNVAGSLAGNNLAKIIEENGKSERWRFVVVTV